MRNARLLLASLVVLWAITESCPAAAPPPRATPAEAYAALGRDHRAARDAFARARRAADSDEERARLAAAEKTTKLLLVGRAWALAERAPDSHVAPLALYFIVNVAPEGERLDAAVVKLRGHARRLDADLLATLGVRLVAFASPEAEKFLRAVRQSSPDRDARGVATFDLARLLKNRGPKRAAEAEKLFAEVADKYADVDGLRGGLGKAAETELFELRHLSIGKTAPQIEGTDGDGKRFKLSDYRGKVVVIDFWGQWCAPCRAANPRHRALVKRLADKPFALLGVNSDPRTAVARAVQAGEVTWRFWWDEGKRGGPIATRWNVHAWPTVYVLDHKGVIRFKGVRGDQLDKAVDGLLAELNKEAKTKR